MGRRRDDKGTSFVPAAPTALFDYIGVTQNLGHTAHFSYAVARDGQRFLISGLRSGATSPATSSPIVVVINWLDGIRRR